MVTTGRKNSVRYAPTPRILRLSRAAKTTASGIAIRPSTVYEIVLISARPTSGSPMSRR
jgi:hypothetical protein